MSRHNPVVRIHHMLDHSQEAVELLRNHSRLDLDTDRTLNLSLVRLMEVVGEAAAQTPVDFQSRYPEVPWRDVVDLRNRLIHGYDSVNLDILWTIVKDDLPPLIEQLEAIIAAEA